MSLKPITHTGNRVCNPQSGLRKGNDIFDVKVSVDSKMLLKLLRLQSGKFLNGASIPRLQFFRFSIFSNMLVDSVLGQQKSFCYFGRRPTLIGQQYCFNPVANPLVSFLFMLRSELNCSPSLKKVMLSMLHVKSNFYQTVSSLTSGITSY